MGILNYENYYLSGENNFLKKYLSNLNENPVIFDIGANVGDYSLECLKFCPGANIYVFEPHPKNFENLKKSLTNENHHFYNIGMVDQVGEVSFYDLKDDDGSCLASLYQEHLPMQKPYCRLRLKLLLIFSFYLPCSF